MLFRAVLRKFANAGVVNQSWNKSMPGVAKEGINMPGLAKEGINMPGVAKEGINKGSIPTGSVRQRALEYRPVKYTVRGVAGMGVVFFYYLPIVAVWSGSYYLVDWMPGGSDARKADPDNASAGSSYVANIRQARRDGLSKFRQAYWKVDKDPFEGITKGTTHKLQNHNCVITRERSRNPNAKDHMHKKKRARKTGLYDSEGFVDVSRRPENNPNYRM